MEDKHSTFDDRSLWQSLVRGGAGRCPSCGKGKLFKSYLKVSDQCDYCNTELHHHRADDAPPYFTIVILGHILIPIVIALETAYRPPLWIHAIIWFPITTLLTLFFLHIVKGAIIGYQWALKMHGFSDNHN